MRALVADAEPDQVPRQADGDAGEQDVEADVQPELDAGEQEGFVHAY